MRYVEAPHHYDGTDRPALFLAGGISSCPDWQADAVAALADDPVTVLNPRRREFPLAGDAIAAQVRWEHRHLHLADAILFWFAAGPSVQPIALYELGVHLTRAVPVVVGADPGYVRRHDLELQVPLARPGTVVLATLAETVDAARRLLVS